MSVISILCPTPAQASELKEQISTMQQHDDFLFTVSTEKMFGYDFHRVIVQSDNLSKLELKDVVNSFIFETVTTCAE